jgi:phosphatidylglycerophosphatase C
VKKDGIAFFDLDGTITTKDTFIDFIVFCRGKFYFLSGLLMLSPLIALYLLKLFPNYRLKEIFFRFYLASYYSADDLENLGKSYSIKILPSIVYKEAINQINWHKEKNHRIIILTASSPLWLSEWCRSNELDIIGTEFVKSGNKYTGKINGKNCLGLQKMLIVEKIINETQFNLTYGYGDSNSDKNFLSILIHGSYKPYWIKKLLPLTARVS